MNSDIRYADLWVLLRRLGYNCDRLIHEKKHRVCEHVHSGSLLTLADYPPDQPVHPQTLYGVRLELDNFGLFSRDEFNRWVDLRTKANAAKAAKAAKANGSNGSTPTRRPRTRIPRRSP